MGLDTQAVIVGHLGVEELCDRLRSGSLAHEVSSRVMRSADHWLIELIDDAGEHRAIDAFINSAAAIDYPDLQAEASTLVSMELGPTSEAIILGLLQGAGATGWFRRHSGENWSVVGAVK